MGRQASLLFLHTLSLSRFAMAAAFLSLPSASVRAALVVAAASSDILDGWLARRFHLASRLGALIDPVADRAFVVTALLALLRDGYVTSLEAALVLVRDVATFIGFLLARAVPSLRQVEFKARVLGKVATSLQVMTLLTALLLPSLLPGMVGATAALGMLAVGDYIRKLWRERALRPTSEVRPR
jgi:CDP-diacylglycerol--glycerol-3-phosphate 3-phosphatidyltransferase